MKKTFSKNQSAKAKNSKFRPDLALRECGASSGTTPLKAKQTTGKLSPVTLNTVSNMYKFSSKLGLHFARLVPALGLAFLANAAALTAAPKNNATQASQNKTATQQARVDDSPEASFEDSDFRKWQFDMGLGIYACDLSTFLGLDLAGYYYLAENHRLKFGLGVFFDASPQTIPNTSFTYRRTSSYSTYTGTGHLKANHYLVPLTAGYQFESSFGKAKKWKWRVGGELGVGVLIGSVELDPHVDNYKNVQGTDVGAVFMAGVTAGINWTFFKTDRVAGALDFSITGYGTSEVKMEYNDCRAPGRNAFDLTEKGNLSGAKFALDFTLKF
jgi:hypothetical protein